MPITELQKKILRLLAEHRNPDSYIAGGIVINSSKSSFRFSKDVDIFHDSIEATQHSAELDITLLKKNNFSVEVTIRQPGFIRCVVNQGTDSLKLEWVQDSAFRFFPIIEDPEFGYRLHDADLATNKCLALANRSEVRDILDLIQIHDSYLSVAHCCWSACAKDPGLNPYLIIELLKKNSKITSQSLSLEQLLKPIDPISLKQRWMLLIEEAENKISVFAPEDIGCIYLRKDNSLVKSPENEDLSKLKKHFGTTKGAWPKIVDS